MQWNLKLREKILAVQHAMASLDVIKLDGKNVSRALQFLVRENKRRRMPFAHPPFRHSVHSLKVSSRRALYKADNIQIGMMRLKFARNGGPVEHRSLQVVTRRRLQLLYDLFEHRFHRMPSKLVPQKLADC